MFGYFIPVSGQASWRAHTLRNRSETSAKQRFSVFFLFGVQQNVTKPQRNKGLLDFDVLLKCKMCLAPQEKQEVYVFPISLCMELYPKSENSKGFQVFPFWPCAGML